jgi:hypothetical protein
MNRNQVDVPTLMRLARWGSDVVLHYLADAPLSTLTLNYRRAVLCAYRGEAAEASTSLTSADVERIVSQQFRSAAIERQLVDTSIDSLSKHLSSLTERMDREHAAMVSMSSQLDSLSSTITAKFVINLRSGKYHTVRHCTGFDHRIWRTACGTPFGGRPDMYEVRVTLPVDPPPLKCYNCFGA